jgi:hypothetical protein
MKENERCKTCHAIAHGQEPRNCEVYRKQGDCKFLQTWAQCLEDLFRKAAHVRKFKDAIRRGAYDAASIRNEAYHKALFIWRRIHMLGAAELKLAWDCCLAFLNTYKVPHRGYYSMWTEMSIDFVNRYEEVVKLPQPPDCVLQIDICRACRLKAYGKELVGNYRDVFESAWKNYGRTSCPKPILEAFREVANRQLDAMCLTLPGTSNHVAKDCRFVRICRYNGMYNYVSVRHGPIPPWCPHATEHMKGGIVL